MPPPDAAGPEGEIAGHRALVEVQLALRKYPSADARGLAAGDGHGGQGDGRVRAPGVVDAEHAALAVAVDGEPARRAVDEQVRLDPQGTLGQDQRLARERVGELDLVLVGIRIRQDQRLAQAQQAITRIRGVEERVYRKQLHPSCSRAHAPWLETHMICRCRPVAPAAGLSRLV